MTYDHELTLISQTVTEDEIGNQIAEEAFDVVFCRIANVGQAERYAARVDDLRLEIKFIIHNFEYAGQKVAQYQGERFRVISTTDGAYANAKYLAFDEIELTCEKVIGNG
jgi:SPP1 family predicted phage head-tail adaptor